MSYPRILQKVFHSPWAIELPMLGSILAVLATRLADDQQHVIAALPAESGPGAGLPANIPLAYARGQRASAGLQLARWGVDRWGARVNFSALAHEAGLKASYAGGSYMQAYQAELASAPAGQTMVVFGSGILGKHLDSMEEMCAGGLSVDKIQAALEEAGSDEKVASVVLHLDTPGGTVYGMPETCALISEVSAAKPIVGFCDSRTASAGYWILSACDSIYLTQSADLGAIGIYSALFDCSEQLKKLGISIELVTDGGKYKGAGAFNLPMTPEQKAEVKDGVMLFSGFFKGQVAKARPGVTTDTMQGQVFTGQQALDAKLADSLVNDLDDVIEDLAAPAA